MLNLFLVGLSSLWGSRVALEGRVKVAPVLLGMHNAGCHHAQQSLSPTWHWKAEREWKPWGSNSWVVSQSMAKQVLMCSQCFPPRHAPKLRSQMPGRSLTSSPWHVCKGVGHRTYSFWDGAGLATIPPPFISIIPELLSMKTGGSPRDFVVFPIQLHRSCSRNSVMIQHKVLIVLNRQGIVGRQNVPLTTFPENLFMGLQ